MESRKRKRPTPKQRFFNTAPQDAARVYHSSPSSASGSSEPIETPESKEGDDVYASFINALQPHRVRQTNTSAEEQPSLEKRSRVEPDQNQSQEDQESILTTCAAAVRITKSLLGYGAENNWLDVERSKGRSWQAGDYRRNWLYVTKKNRANPLAEQEENTFYYFQPSLESKDAKENYIVRKALCAILAHSGSCDEHAYVLATLLRHLLPIGTQINICAFRSHTSASDFPHTFVVIGNARNENSRLNAEELEKYRHNDGLIAADAWPIQGGAILLKDFFLRKNAYSPSDSKAVFSLHIDHTFYADGKDRITGRVKKQKDYAKEATERKLGHHFSPLGLFFHHELETQHNLNSKIYAIPLHGYRECEGMWEANSVAHHSSPYSEPPKTRSKLSEIIKSNAELRALLEMTDEELNVDDEPGCLPPRLGSGFSN